MTTTFGNSSPDLVEIMHDIRTQLSQKGCHSFRLLTQAFAVNDRQSTNQFGFDAFVAVLGKVGVFLSLQNAKKMFRYFEQLQCQSTGQSINPSNQPGSINFIEFLQTLQGMMSQRRFDLICQLFDTIDQSINQSKTGIIHFQAILDRFDPRMHPEVLSGKKSVNQLQSEFIAAFDGSINQSINGRITRDSFIDFYAGISACTPLDDDFFCTTLERCFSINQSINQSMKRSALLKSVRNILRTRISTRDQAGPRTESEKLRGLLKWYDLKNSGLVDFNQFHGALQRFGLVLDDKTVHSLFEAFDYEYTGNINYAEFVAVLYEEDLVSNYWSERQKTHNQSINQSINEEKTQERQYLSNDSIILSTPKFPAPGTINQSLHQPINQSIHQSINRPVTCATAVFVLGGPGSGKGTQCARIVSEFGYTHLSTGDLLRIEQNNPSSQFGSLINQCITEGKLVPMKLIVQLLEQAILTGMKEGRSNYLVDGFPRAVDQIGCWNEIMGKHAVKVPFVLYFDVPLPVLEQRLIARGQTSGRADDNIESIKKRFITFETESRPVVSHFAQEGRVRVLDGTQTPDQVYQLVRESMKSLEK